MFDFIPEFFWKIIIALVGAIYALVNYTYQVFLFIARTNIFNQSTYTDLVDRIYVILGVVMLFVIAYNILNLVVDPDKNSKGTTIEKMLKNIVISFILIVLCPSIFSFAFQLQTSILTTNGGIINNLFADSVQDVGGDDTIADGGKRMAVNTFKAFFVPVEGKDYSLNSRTGSKNYTLAEAEEEALESGSFNPYQAFAMNIVKDEVEFNWLIALIAGGYLVYVIVSFCFDLAVRACKLAFYQIIAPIAITCRILPNDKDIFNSWMKATIKTYLSVFIRILIMNLGVYLVSVFVDSNFFDSCDGAECIELAWGVKLIGYAFVILGIVTFIKQAPKLIDDIFHLGDDVSLGIRDKLKAASVFHAGSTLGAGTTAAVRNASQAIKKVKDAKGGKAKAAEVFKGIGSTVAGAASGSVRGFRQGRNAGSWSEMSTAAGKGATGATDARDARDARNLRYKAEGKNFITGHRDDWAAGVKDWATGGVGPYEGDIKTGKDFKNKAKEIETETESLMNKFKNNAKLVADMTEFKGDPNNEILKLYQEYKAKGLSLEAIEADIARQKGITDFSTMVDKSRFYSPVDYQALEQARQQAAASVNRNSAEFLDAAGNFDQAKYDEAVKNARAAVQEAQFRTFDQDGYNAAIEAAATEHGKRIANLNNMYNQLWKESRLTLQDKILADEDGSILNGLGMKPKDVGNIIAKVSEFEAMFKAAGNRVESPDVDQATGTRPVYDKIDRGDSAGHRIDDIASTYDRIGAIAAAESARIRQQAQARNDGKDK